MSSPSVMCDGKEARFKVQLCSKSKKRQSAGKSLKRCALSETRRLGENCVTVWCPRVDTCVRRPPRNPFPPDEGNAAVDTAHSGCLCARAPTAVYGRGLYRMESGMQESVWNLGNKR